MDALGLAFQVRDDILDIEGTTAETGKTGGSDLAKDKATYPHLFGMPKARQRADELLQQATDALAAVRRRATMACGGQRVTSCCASGPDGLLG